MDKKTFQVVGEYDNIEPYMIKAKGTEAYYQSALFTHSLGITPITYIDADICFYRDIEEILSDTCDASFVEHRIPSYPNVGKYNVGVVHFNSQKALDFFADCCINPEKYPEYHTCYDQKFLELIYKKFDCEVMECGHGAWWCNRFYEFTGRDIIWNGKRFPFVFMHFSKVRLVEKGFVHGEALVKTGNYYDEYYTYAEMKPMNDVLKNYYDDYATSLRKITARLAGV